MLQSSLIHTAFHCYGVSIRPSSYYCCAVSKWHFKLHLLLSNIWVTNILSFLLLLLLFCLRISLMCHLLCQEDDHKRQTLITTNKNKVVHIHFWVVDVGSNKRNIKCCLSRLTTRTKQTLRAFEYLSNKSEDMQNVIDCRTRKKNQLGDTFPFETGTTSCRINNTLHSNIQTYPFPTIKQHWPNKQIKLNSWSLPQSSVLE